MHPLFMSVTFDDRTGTNQTTSRPLRSAAARVGSVGFLLMNLCASMVFAAGTAMFDVGTNTGEKPQSKIWYNDASYWAVLDGPNGVSFYEKNGDNWDEGSFVDANIASGGAADVLWNGSELFVLVYSGSTKLYKYTYDSSLRSYDLLSGFPVNIPTPSGSETMTFDQDSTGRLWATAEGGGDVNVYYTTSADHQSWSSEIVLQSGLDADDISAVIAFGGNKIGVFWSDQSAEEYGFRVHNDSDSPGTWSSMETVDSGSGVADDHLNLATDSSGRVWCATKNADNELQVHRRSTSGSWTTEQDASAGTGTRPIIMVNEDDDLLYFIYVNWDTDPRSVYYRTSSLGSLSFSNTTAFLTHGSLAMNNPTGLKQILPAGNLMCIATLDDAEAWWNGFGDPPGGGGGPTPPRNLTATLLTNPDEVDLAWDEPTSGPPDGYNVHRSVDGGSFTQINGSLVTNTNFTDSSPPAGVLCYEVTAETDNQETSASNTDCVDTSPPVPPENLVATLNQNPDEVDLTWDEPTSGAPDGYNIYRQVGGNSFVQINGSLVTSTTYTDTSPPGDALCYRVTAETNGTETADSNTDCVDNTPPAPPTNLTASLQQMPDEVTLSWDEPSTGAPDGYNIYRQADGGSFTQINGSLVTSLGYTDSAPPQVPLCYEVTAVTNAEETSASNTDCVDNTPPSPPDAPENLTITQVDPGSLSRVLGLNFDETFGQMVNDFSGAGNHGFLGGSPAVDAADPVFGASNGRGYLTFNGNSSFLLIPDSPTFDFTGSFTLEAWIRSGLSADGTVIEKGSGSNRTFSLTTTSAGEVNFSWDDNGVAKSAASPAVLSSNTWHHVACVYDDASGENRIYVDGLLVQASNASGIPNANETPTCIGAAIDSTGFFDGDIDQVHVFADAVYDADFVPPTSKTSMGGEATAAAVPGGNLPELAAGGAGVLLEWNAPSAGVTAVSYNVWRTIDSNTEQLNSVPLTTTRFLDADSTLGPRCYEVTAVSILDLEGLPSTEECTDVTAPSELAAAPEQVASTLFEMPDFTVIAWQAPSQGPPATGYHVYRSVNGSFPQRLTTQPVVGLSYDDLSLAAGQLTYSVRSLVADGREGLAASDTALTFTPPPPSEPTFVAAAEDTTQGPASGVAAYRMNDGSGQTLEDATGNGHTGQLGSSPSADSADPIWVSGISGGSLQFDGVNDYVRIEDAADLQIAGSFTVEAWFKLTGSGDHAILSKGGSQERNYWIIIEAGGVIDFRWESPGGANHGTASSSVVQDSNWHHVACVYDMEVGENRIYYDGVLIQQASDSGTPTTSTDPLYIGGRISSSSIRDEFEGCIDLVRISDGVAYVADFTPPTDYNSSGSSNPLINVAWNAPTSGYTTHYKVFRAVDSGPWTCLDSTVTALSYVDASLDSVGPLVCYSIMAVDGAGSAGPPSPSICIGSGQPTSVWEGPKDLQTVPLAGLRVGPNPFNPSVRIQFDVVREGRLTLQIFDVRGRLVDTLWNAVVRAGPQSHVWRGTTSTGRSVGSGSYFVVLRSADGTERRKITLVR